MPQTMIVFILAVGSLLFDTCSTVAQTRNKFDIQRRWFMDYSQQTNDAWHFVRLIYNREEKVSAAIFVCPHKGVPYLQLDLPPSVSVEGYSATEHRKNIDLVINNSHINGSLERGSLYVDRSDVQSLTFDKSFGDGNNQIEIKVQPYGDTLLLDSVDKDAVDMTEAVRSSKGVLVGFDEMMKGCIAFKESP